MQAPQLLPSWEKPSSSHLGKLGVLSSLAHVVIGLMVFAVSEVATSPVRPVQELTVGEARRMSTTLVMPPGLLTQQAPNQTQPAKELTMASLPPRPPTVASSPGAPPPMPRQVPRPVQVLPETSSIAPTQSANLESPTGLGVPNSQLPAPRIDVEEKPKLAFERPGAITGQPIPGQTKIPVPKNSVEEAIRQVARGVAPGGLVVGDEDVPSTRFPSTPLPMPGKMGSSVEMLSDPAGVDFWPYLVKVLASIRRNWFAVIPETARLGRIGRSVVRFTISKDGGVRAVEIATPSGTESFDRAAIAGISASNPLPPLPNDFRGASIRLQFVFKYNVK